MALLTGAITALGLAGVAVGHEQNFSGKAPSVAYPRTYSETFTARGPHALPMRVYGDFSGKVALAYYEKAVSDTVRAYVSEGNVGNVDADATDTLVIVVTDTAQVRNYKVASDTVRPVITDAYTALLKSSNPLLSKSDTATPVVTETASVRVLLTVSDTATATVTDAYTALGQANGISVSDTVTAVITENRIVLAQAASVSKTCADTIRPVVAESSAVRASGDVDRIEITSRPTGLIHINER